MKSTTLVSRAQLEEKTSPSKPASHLEAMKKVFAEAKTKFSSESRKPWSRSRLGTTRFGLFSAIRHFGEKPPESLEAKLTECKHVSSAFDACYEYLHEQNQHKIHTHSFVNYLWEELQTSLPEIHNAFLDRMLHPIKYAVKIAFVKIHMDSFKKGDESSIDCQFKDEKRNEKNINEFKLQIDQCGTFEEEKKVCIEQLNKHKSLWDPRCDQIHHFNNYVLMELRFNHIEAYKSIVGSRYGIAFIPNDRSITLYRRETLFRNVFEEGFKLKEEYNQPHICKDRYADALGTGSLGISLAKDIPSPFFGDHLYEVFFKKGHKYLIIDINASPRNRGHERRDVNEANCLFSISSHCIFKWIDTSTEETRENPNFCRERAIEPPPSKLRGCF